MTTGTKRGKFVAWGIVLLVVVLAGVGFTTWYAYHSSQLANDVLQSANRVSNDIPKLPQIKTFADCQKAHHSKILTTYPAQCVTTNGKTFTDNSQKYLVVKEWGIKFQLPTNLGVMDYQIKGNYAYLGSPQLTGLATTCATDQGSLGVMSRSLTLFNNAVKLGNYYYGYSGPQSSCTDNATNAHKMASNLQVTAENQLRQQLLASLTAAN